MANIQVERKFGWEQEKYSLAKEKKLGKVDKNLTTPVPVYAQLRTEQVRMLTCKLT